MPRYLTIKSVIHMLTSTKFKTFAELEDCLYYYRARLASNYDGDTVRLRIDLGLEQGAGVFGKGIPFRLYGIDAPELRGEEKEMGRLSRDALRELIFNADNNVIVRTVKTPRGEDKRGKYGRYLATLYLGKPDGTVLNVNGWLVEENLAEVKHY